MFFSVLVKIIKYDFPYAGFGIKENIIIWIGNIKSILFNGSVGSIKTGIEAEEIIAGGKEDGDVPLDLIAAGRMFQRNPGLVWAWADELETSIKLAHQIAWGVKGRKKGTSQNVV